MKLIKILFVLFLGVTTLYAQDVTVTGTVTDDEGNALEGASVFITELSRGTVTDPNGAYELNLPAGRHIVQFSYIGFTDVAKTVNLSTESVTLDVTLNTGVNLDEVVIVSGSRKAEKITNSPSTIVTVSANEISQYAGNPAELLSRNKGVDYFRAGIALPAFNIRGFNSNFNSKNLQVNDGRNSSLIATGLPMGPLATTIKEDIEQIEVVLGPNATLYGPNAHNGLINTISKDPRKYEGTTIATNLGVNADGNGFYSGRLRFARKLNDKWAIKATGEYTQATEFIYADSVYIDRNADGVTEGYPEFELDNDVNFLRTEASVYFTPKEGTDIVATYGHSNSTYLSPTNVGRNQIIDWRINFFQLRFKTRNFFAQVYRTGSKTDDTYSIDERTKQYYRGIAAGLSEEEASGEFSYQSGARFIDDSERWNAEAQYNNTFGKLELIGGLQWQLDRANSKGTYLLDETDDDFIDISQIGGYVHLDYDFGNGFSGIAATRIDNHEVYGTNVVPKFGLLKEFDKGTLRLTYGQGIAAPTILNLYGNLFSGLILGNSDGFTLADGSTVDPQGVEKVNTYEIGYRGSVTSDLYADVNAYYSVNKDFLSPVTVVGVATQRGNTPIEEVQSGFGAFGGLVATYINFGEVNTYGADLALTYVISPKWNLRANYSYFDYSFDENNTDNDFNGDGDVNFLDFLINSPRNKFGLGINHTGSKFFASLFTRWVEEYNYFSSFQIASETLPGFTYRGLPIVENTKSADTFNYGPLGGFVTFDLNFGFNVNKNLTLSLAATNLFNSELREFTAAPPTGGLYVAEALIKLD